MTRTQTTKSITKKKAGLLLSTDRESGNICQQQQKIQVNKEQQVRLTKELTLLDLRTFLFPVSGFCYYQDICVMRERKN